MTIPETLKELARREFEKFKVTEDDFMIIFGKQLSEDRIAKINYLTTDDCDAILKQIEVRIMLMLDWNTKTIWAKTYSMDWDTHMLWFDTHETEKLPATLEGTRWAIENYLKENK